MRCPRWSPDGTHIVFYSLRSGNRDIWVMPAGGGSARQITSTQGSEYHPVWSPDGREIGWMTFTIPNQVWKARAAGGVPEKVTEGGYPAWSADGRWIFFARQGQIWRIPAAGGTAQQVTSAAERSGRPWPTRDGRMVMYFTLRNRVWGVSAMLADDSRELHLLDPGGRRGILGLNTLSSDGQFAYFTWGETIGDLWVADLGGRP